MKMGCCFIILMTFMVCSKAAFYLYKDIKTTWDEGRSKCFDRGMSLAVLKSEQDYNEAKLYIKNVIGALEIKIFIGLYYDPVQDVFRWTDGNLLTYKKWASGHPLAMETDHCVRLSKDLREFESDLCSTTRNILCSDHAHPNCYGNVVYRAWKFRYASVAGLSSQMTSKPFVTKPTVKQSNLAYVSTQISTQEKTSLSHVGLQTPKDDISSTPMTTEKTMFRHVTTHRTDVSTESTSQQTSEPFVTEIFTPEPTVKQSSLVYILTRMSTQEITSLSPVRLQTPKDDISSTPMTTEKTILSHVTTHRTDVSTESLCPCDCYMNSNKSNAIDDNEVKEIKRRIQKELRVDKSTLSSTRNKRISAYDDRTSSKCIGAVGICILVTVLSVFAATDVMSCFQ